MKPSNYWPIWSVILILILTACSGGAVVFAPTPLPPDLSPQVYQHPSGAFQLTLPPNWPVYAQDTPTLATAAFSLPDQSDVVLRVALINTGAVISPQQLADIMTQYQTRLRPDLERYVEQDRQAMGDGSWRVTGVRTTTAGSPEPVNTFLIADGAALAVLEVSAVTDATLRGMLEQMISSFRILSADNLETATLSTLSIPASVQLEIVSANTWTTANGVFYITGEVVNNSRQTLAGVPIRGTLLRADGGRITEAIDLIMGYAVEPGEFAPFGLRFGEGQPPDATSFAVTTGGALPQGGEWVLPETEPVIFSDGALTWTDEIQFGADGNLFITGSIVNGGTEPVYQPRATVTVFSDTGRVIGAAFADAVSAVLAPDETTTYTILVSDVGGNAANYVVNVQALPCDGRC